MTVYDRIKSMIHRPDHAPEPPGTPRARPWVGGYLKRALEYSLKISARSGWSIPYSRMILTPRGVGAGQSAEHGRTGTQSTHAGSRRYRSCGGGARARAATTPPPILAVPALPAQLHRALITREPAAARTASNVTGLPHLQVVTLPAPLTTAVAMPTQAQHIPPQEPSCNSYGSSTDLPPTRAVLRGHNRRRWAALG